MDRQIWALYNKGCIPSPLNGLSHLILRTLGCRYCFHSHLTDRELRLTDCELFVIITCKGRAGI